MRVRFNLKNRQDEPGLVLLIFRYDAGRFVYSTGQHVPQRFWDAKNNRVVSSAKYPPHKQLNALLGRLEATCIDTYLSFLNRDRTPTFDDLRAALDEVLHKKPVKRLQLFDFLEQLTKERAASGRYAHYTIMNYKVVTRRLRDFARDKGKRVDFDTISLELFYDLCQWSTEQGHAQNTQRKTVQTFKVFLNEAIDRGLTTNKAHLSKRFTVAHEVTQAIYLNLDELKAMYRVELPDHLDRVRDLFLLGCFTGLRFGDFSTLDRADVVTLEGRQYIRKVTSKTRQEVLIPLHPIARTILAKYGGSPPPTASNKHVNESVKEVGRLAGISGDVTISRLVRGRLVSRTVPKYSEITTHTARRSFATNAFLSGVPAELIMKITGHKTEAAFRRYIRAGAAEYAITSARHQFFEGWG